MENVAEEVAPPKRKLELVYKMYFLYFKLYFMLVFHTFKGVYYIPAVCITYQAMACMLQGGKHTRKYVGHTLF